MSSRAGRLKIAAGAVATAAAAAAAVLVATAGAGAPRLGAASPAFAWLRPGPLPAGWSVARLPHSPAALPAPPGWRSERSDPGTRTAVRTAAGGEIVGYLNATPREGAESLSDWRGFRVEHNRDEGDTDVKLLAAASGLAFRSGRGSCVLDSYRTSTGNRYREIACIVAGAATTVIVGAAPPDRWAAAAPRIERAISAFTT